MSKRPLDLVVAGTALVVLSPLIAVAMLLVLLSLGRPITFRQTRIGRDGCPFVLLKLRTMRSPSAPGAELDDDDVRLTRIGRWLRASSIDELPELWNVLTGDMSLVGPRPLLPQYLPLYSTEQSRRHDVRPGLTGLAQASGRNSLSWEEKFALDVQYVDRRSLLLDLQILCRTAILVLRGDGVTADGHASAPFFTGADQGDSVAPSDPRATNRVAR